MVSRTPGFPSGHDLPGAEWTVRRSENRAPTGAAICQQCGAPLDPRAATRTRRKHRTGACITDRQEIT